MGQLEFKKKIFNAGKACHQTVIDDYRQRIDALQAETANRVGGTMDIQEMSFNNETNDRIRLLAEQLNFAIEEMNLLNKMKVEEPLHDVITLGSVVETDRKTFFVSVSIEDFEVDGKPIFGLSTKTPLYAEMAGKKKGEIFKFRDTVYKIKKVY